MRFDFLSPNSEYLTWICVSQYIVSNDLTNLTNSMKMYVTSKIMQFNPCLHLKLQLVQPYPILLDSKFYCFDVWNHHSYQICLRYQHQNRVLLHFHGQTMLYHHLPFLLTPRDCLIFLKGIIDRMK